MNKTRILFVCLGNICRSPSAEAIFLKLIRAMGVDDKFVVDSAGTSGWHMGDFADRRMQKHAINRGYDLLSLSRKFYADSDFSSFNLIIAMDEENMVDLRALARSKEEYDKIVRMCDYSKTYTNIREVPDPYLGGDAGFELVLDILEDACSNLLESLLKK